MALIRNAAYLRSCFDQARILWKPFSYSLATVSTQEPGRVHDTHLQLPNTKVPLTPQLEFTGSVEGPKDAIPAFRMLNPGGTGLIEGANQHLPDDATLVKMYKCMATVQVMDTIFYDAQRQGRFSFYMTCTGEEASVVSSAAALDPNDALFAQYREHAAFLWRGFSIQQMANQCFGNEADPSKGRQMPIHYGSRELNMPTVSSVLATQLPHAAGAAYAFKMKGERRVAAAYIGDGGSSEGDTHAAFSFATTLQCPAIFLCRNNSYAISTPASQNFVGPGVAERAAAFGLRSVRVDGGDALAVFVAVREARRLALESNCPSFVEMMTYRAGHHSTSDDASRYRDEAETDLWRRRDPVERLRAYLEKMDLWDDSKESALRTGARTECTAALRTAAALPKHPATAIFSDVYATMPRHLEEQQAEMLENLERHPELRPTGVPLAKSTS